MKVVLQAGHCFRTSGSTGTRSYLGRPTEQEVAWEVANRAADKIRAVGHDAAVILADPASEAEYRGDAFVAIHCDGSVSSSAHGASTGYRTDEGRAFAHAWKRAYADLGWVGFRADNYTAALQGYYGTRAAIRQGNRRAFIAELGFLTNPDDEARITSDAGYNRAADAIVIALGLTAPPTNEEDELDATERTMLRNIHNWVAALSGIQQTDPADGGTRRGWDFEHFDRAGKTDPNQPPRAVLLKWAIESTRNSRLLPGLVAQVASLTETVRQLSVDGAEVDYDEIERRTEAALRSTFGSLDEE